MDDATESKAPPSLKSRPPVPLPRKSVPQRGSKTHSEHKETGGEAPKLQPEPRTKGAYAKIKSILGKNESEKPKLPPRPPAKGSRNYGVIPRSGNERVHERKKSDSSESNCDSRERKPVPRESKDRVPVPRVPPSGSRTSPTGAVPRQTSRSGRPAPARQSSDQQVNYKRSHSQRPQITSKNKLLETAQKALEKSIRAELDVENSKYLEATKKYQECLDDIDLVLETPLRKLQLSERDKFEAEAAVKEMRRLRKNVLQGFSDAQIAYCLPQSMVDIPAEAPPSYNDVLMEDLLENNNEIQGDAAILQPISTHATGKTNAEKSSNLIDILSVGVPAVTNDQSNQLHGVQHQVPVESVKPKVKTRFPDTGRQEFPGDVIVPREQKIRFPADKASKNMSCDSIPDSDFVTAQSTPIVSPFKQTRANNPHAAEFILNDVRNHLNKLNLNIDPFQNENPFAEKFESNLNNTHGDIFGEIGSDESDVKQLQEVSFLANTSFNTQAVYSPTNPFVKDLTSEPVTNDVKAPCTKISSSNSPDLFGDLADEVRKQFGQTGSPPSANETNLAMTPQPVTRTVNKQQVTVQSPLGIKALNEIESNDLKTPEDHFTKRKKQAQSVMNISESVEKESRVPNRHPLTRLKKMSKSNESLLQMFDPIKGSHDSSSLSEENSYAVEEPQNEARKTVSFGDEEEEKKAQEENMPLVDVSEETQQIEINKHSRESSEIESSSSSSENSSLYPKLSGVEDSAEVELSNNFSSSSSNSIAERYSISTTTAIPTQKNEVEDFDPGAAIAPGIIPPKRTLPPKPARKKVDPNGRNIQERERSGVTIGRSAFYAKEAGKTEVRQSEGDAWLPVFHVKEGVKLFFLTDSGVSSPFNRQTIQLLKKSLPPPGSRTAESKVRLEVGGELFARDLQGKTTRVLMDEHGAYIIEASEGVFICLVLTSKVEKAQIIEMERMFEIYTNLAKEPRAFNLGNNNVDNAARNAMKVVQKKVPGIVKTHSVRAMKKIRGAIGKEEVRQELAKEFTALKDASVQFREARMRKDIVYF